MEAYRKDLAQIHHTGYDAVAAAAAQTLVKTLQQHKIRKGLVVDLGCGSGIFAKHLIEAGYAVLGIDISPDMIRIAKRTVPRASFKVDSFLRASIPDCIAVTAIGECFNYLFDISNGERALKMLFDRVHTALHPNGLFVFDVLTDDARVKRRRQDFRVEADWAIHVDVERDPRKKSLVRRITTFHKTGALYRRDEETHRQRLYSGTQLIRWLKKAGFDVKTLYGYGSLEFEGGHIVLMNRNRKGPD